VQQQFYNSRSTNLNAAGVLTDTLTARQDSAVTRAFGVPPLKEETSRNYSLGLVAKPTDTFRLTVDAFRIDIKDRIIFSSNIQPEPAASCGTPFNPTRCPISAILAPFRAGQVQFFTNAIDTKTQGLDIVAVYDWALGHGSTVTLDAALDFNKTEVTNIRSSSSILPPSVLFDRSQVTLVEEGQPRQHFVVGGAYHRGGWRADLRFNYFGSVAGEGFTPRPADCALDYCGVGAFRQEWGGKWLADASLTVPLRQDRVSLTVGALNLFNTKPDKWSCDVLTDPSRCQAFPFPSLGFIYGWETLPFGINGGYYYARVSVRFDHH